MLTTDNQPIRNHPDTKAAGYPYSLSLYCAVAAGSLTLAVVHLLNPGPAAAKFSVSTLWLGLLPIDAIGAGAAALTLWRLHGPARRQSPATAPAAPQRNAGARLLRQAALTTFWIYPSVVGITVLTTLCLKKAGLEAPVSPLIQAATRSHDPVFWISLAFASVFLAPLAEEFLFRLVLFESLRELNIRLPTLLSAACFAVVHQAPTHLPGLFLLGLILSRARKKSGGLPLPMLIHGMFNAASLTFLWFSRSPGG